MEQADRVGAAKSRDEGEPARPLRLVFMGTSAFAVPSLVALAALTELTIVQVVTQPARPSGRGRSLQPTPVQTMAEHLGLPVWQPERLRRPEAVARLRDCSPELIVVAAYGQLLSPAVLALPSHGCLNVHASLLPRYRGASPIVGALLAGETETGVTIMLMDAGLDTGPILSQRATPIEPDETAQALTERLADLGARLLGETLPAWLAGQLAPRPQAEHLATLTRPVRKEDGWIDWAHPAEVIVRAVRAYTPWPGAVTTLRCDERTERLVIRAARAWPGPDPTRHGSGPVGRGEAPLRPGEGGLSDGRAVIGTGQGLLEPISVQPAGRRPMTYSDFLRGRRLRPEQVRVEAEVIT